MSLYDDICAYEPFNEQEAADKPVILRALRENPACFDRAAQAHMACSIWVVDPALTQTLLVYHNIYDSWSWIGGHADGEHNLAAVALRELEEETGVSSARLVPCKPCSQLNAQIAEAQAPTTSNAHATNVGRRGAIGSDASSSHTDSGTTDALSLAEKLRYANTPDSAAAPNLIYSLEVLTVNGHEKRGVYVSSHLHLNVTYLAVADPHEPLRVKPDENSGVRWAPLDDAIALSTEPWIRERIYRKLIDKLQLLRQDENFQALIQSLVVPPVGRATALA